MRPLPILLPVLALLSACNSHGGANDLTTRDKGEFHGYAGIGPADTLNFTGTEPFWGGNVTGTALTYTTPEKSGGTAITVERFAGNNGLGLSGKLDGNTFDMMVSEAPCSDGMSDRTYPFTVTLQIGGETRNGCGWTAKRRFTGPERP